MIQSLTRIKVRYYETDQMGIVHHSNFIRYFEIARTDWLTQLNISYKDMEKEGIILPVISINCNYKQSAYYDDELTIETKLTKTPTVKIAFDYEIKNQENQLICNGSTVLAFLDKKTRKPIRCPEYILKKLSISNT